MEIGKMLKEKRAEYELTQEQLSEQIFVSKKTISNWETGKTTPDLDSLIRLATLFNLSLDNLLLEGNKVAENIIKREKIGEELDKNKKIWSFSYVINIIFVITMSMSSLFKVSNFSMGTGVKVSMLLIMFMNLYLLGYLTKEKKRLELMYSLPNHELEKHKEKAAPFNIKIFIGVLILLFILVLIPYLF